MGQSTACSQERRPTQRVHPYIVDVGEELWHVGCVVDANVRFAIPHEAYTSLSHELNRVWMIDPRNPHVGCTCDMYLRRCRRGAWKVRSPLKAAMRLYWGLVERKFSMYQQSF